jgi:hypothetical protein
MKRVYNTPVVSVASFGNEGVIMASSITVNTSSNGVQTISTTLDLSKLRSK